MSYDIVDMPGAKNDIHFYVPVEDRPAFYRAVKRLTEAQCGVDLDELLENYRAVIVMELFKVTYLYQPRMDRSLILSVKPVKSSRSRRFRD